MLQTLTFQIEQLSTHPEGPDIFPCQQVAQNKGDSMVERKSKQSAPKRRKTGNRDPGKPCSLVPRGPLFLTFKQLFLTPSAVLVQGLGSRDAMLTGALA